MSVRVSSALLRGVITAAAASPDEICGLLFGSAGVIAEARPCRNIAPDPRRRFEIDPAALLRAHREARNGGPALIGCYHSHPDGDPIPSASDAADAAANAWLWLIIGGREARLFRSTGRGELHGRFDQVELIDIGCHPQLAPQTPLRHNGRNREH